MHVAQISFFIDPQGRKPEQLLQEWVSLVDVAEAAAGTGVRVSVIQACAHSQKLTRNGVDYHFIAPDSGASTIAAGKALGELIRALAPDVFHVHGLGFPADVLTLAELAPRVPILLQDHASRPPRFWRRRLWRRQLSSVSGVAFCSRDQAEPFEKVGLIAASTAVYGIPTSTSRFTPGDRAEARRITELTGDPGLLWVGNLDRNKDPLSVLEGVSEAVRYLPNLQLWCCFGTAPLLAEVRNRIERDARLASRVHLLGRVPHEQVERLMRAADLFVLGSHRESCGFALIEALACGLPPVVTDIPSFRSLTAEESVGRLWPCDDAQRFCTALVSIALQPQSRLRAATRAHFDAELSFDAVGRKLVGTYQNLIERKSARA